MKVGSGRRRLWLIMLAMVLLGGWRAPARAGAAAQSVTISTRGYQVLGSLATDGEHVVWLANPVGTDIETIFAAGVDGGSPIPVASIDMSDTGLALSSPRVENGVVVWLEYAEPGPDAVKGYDLSTGQTFVLSDPGARIYPTIPAIDGDHVAWFENDAQGFLIRLRNYRTFEPATLALRLDDTPVYGTAMSFGANLSLDGTSLAWSEGGDYPLLEVWHYDMGRPESGPRLVDDDLSYVNSVVLEGDALAFEATAIHLVDLRTGRTRLLNVRTNSSYPAYLTMDAWQIFWESSSGLYGYDVALAMRYTFGAELSRPATGRGVLAAVNEAQHSLVVQPVAAVLPTPSAPVANPGQPDVLFFPETSHTLRGIFRSFWEQHGGLAVFGFPTMEEMTQHNADTERFYTVQYFERQRFEHHPENAGTVYEVLLGRLGAEALARQGRDWPSFPKASPSAPHYFHDTGHAIAEVFWGYWSSHGLEFDGRDGKSYAESLALFGMPLSEPAMETNSSGDTVLTQWFERARFEYHPGNPDPFKVLLGRLAADSL